MTPVPDFSLPLRTISKSAAKLGLHLLAWLPMVARIRSGPVAHFRRFGRMASPEAKLTKIGIVSNRAVTSPHKLCTPTRTHHSCDRTLVRQARQFGDARLLPVVHLRVGIVAVHTMELECQALLVRGPSPTVFKFQIQLLPDLQQSPELVLREPLWSRTHRAAWLGLVSTRSNTSLMIFTASNIKHALKFRASNFLSSNKHG